MIHLPSTLYNLITLLTSSPIHFEIIEMDSVQLLLTVICPFSTSITQNPTQVSDICFSLQHDVADIIECVQKPSSSTAETVELPDFSGENWVVSRGG